MAYSVGYAISLSKTVVAFGDNLEISFNVIGGSAETVPVSVTLEHGGKAFFGRIVSVTLAPNTWTTVEMQDEISSEELREMMRDAGDRAFTNADVTIYVGRVGSQREKFTRSAALTVYDKVDPEVTLNAYRVQNVDDPNEADEGKHIWTSVGMRFREPGFETLVNSMSAYIVVRNVGTGAVVLSKGLTVSDYFDTTVDGTALVETGEEDPYSTGYDYEIELSFGDQYESVSKKIIVPLAFANVHLSGASTGGVCFGGFSTAKEGRPKFECRYPTTFFSDVYRDIGGVSVPLGGMVYEFDDNQKVGPEQQTADVWMDQRHIYRRFCKLDAHASGTQTQNVADVTAWGSNVSIVNLRGMLYSAAEFTGNAYPLPYAHYTAAQEVALYVEDGMIKTYAYGSTRTWVSGWVMVEYVRDEGAVKTKFPMSPATGANTDVYFASSEYSTAYAAWKAFDNNIATSWSAGVGAGAGAWVAYKLPEALRDIDVVLYGRKHDNLSYIKSGVVEVSHDGQIWTQAGSFSNWTSKTAGGLMGTIQCNGVSDSEYFEYVRIKTTEIGGTYSYVTVGYIQVLGYTQDQ